jgi:hypothetical protein
MKKGKKSGYPIHRILSKNTGNNYILEFQKIDRVLQPSKPTNYHTELMNRMAIMENSDKDSIEFDIVTPILDISNPNEKEIPLKIMFPGPLDIIFKIKLDPNKNELKGKAGMRIKCVLRRL